MHSQDFMSNNPQSEEEEDYMNMVIAEPSKSREKETYTQRRLRKEREAEARGRPKSKVEIAREEKIAREEALSKSLLADSILSSTNKGLAMMTKMGFKPGAALGSKDNVGARLEPIGITMKEDRGGIGLDSEKKRKLREEAERVAKRAKAEEGEYRERVRREREEMRLERMVSAAMRIAERMDGQREEEKDMHANRNGALHSNKDRAIFTKPLNQINVLWRGLVREREERERDRRMRYDLQQSLYRLPTYEDPDEEHDDQRALGKIEIQHTLVEDLEEEDPELDEFKQSDPADRLKSLVKYLRTEHNYCFFCKCSYPDQNMDGCPGMTEEDHD